MNAKMSWTAVLAAVAVLIPQPAYAQAVSDAGTAADDYSIFYSPPDRVDALFAAFLDVMPLQTREDALAAFQAMWDHSAAENNGKPEAYYWSGAAASEYRVSEEDIIPLEADFGNMPEYWQFRYYLSRAEPDEKILLLQKAMDVAPDDAASLFLYWQETANSGAGIYRSIHMKFGTRNEEQLTPEELGICRNWPQLPAEGMERAARMDGQNAMMYYWTAQKYSILGETEHVIELLGLGNACPHNVGIHLFPLSYTYAHLEDIRSIVGAERDGCMVTLSVQWAREAIPNYIKLKDVVKQICVAANLGCEMQWLNTAHEFACRFGQTEHAGMIQQLVANVLVGVLAEHAMRLWGTMSPDEARGFSRLYQKKGVISGASRCWHLSSQYYGEKLAGLGYYSLGLPEEPPTPEEMVELFSSWPVNREFEINVIGETLASVFKSMEAFDYTDPAAYRGY